MATAQEMVADLAALKTQLNNATTRLGKVATETQSLLDKIAELEETMGGGNLPQDLVDAFNEVKAAAAGVDAAVSAADEKVPDAPPPSP